jgi:hypothetical protein
MNSRGGKKMNKKTKKQEVGTKEEKGSLASKKRKIISQIV